MHTKQLPTNVGCLFEGFQLSSARVSKRTFSLKIS